MLRKTMIVLATATATILMLTASTAAFAHVRLSELRNWPTCPETQGWPYHFKRKCIMQGGHGDYLCYKKSCLSVDGWGVENAEKELEKQGRNQ